MNNDPWKDLTPPNVADSINAKRINAEIPWGFFWARGIDQKCMLVLKHNSDLSPHGHLPKLKGIEVILAEGNNDRINMLVLKLLDSSQRDIFFKLCTDIVAGASDAVSEREAVEVALARTWRWHHLLRGGSDGRLTAEEQKGLIGELSVLENYLLPVISAFDAVSAWCGPQGAPKDFEIGRVCIEAKARRGVATPFITINSEFQLDESGTDFLFLYVVDLDRAQSDSRMGISITDIAQRIKDRIAEIDNGAVIKYEASLSAAGFRWEDNYSDSLWIMGISRLFRVEGDFPRITAVTVMPGVANVKYSISLAACESYRIADSTLEAILEG